MTYRYPENDDLSSEAFMDHIRYSLAEAFGIHPSELRDYSSRELEKMIDFDYEDHPEQQKPSTFERIKGYLGSAI